MTKAKAQEKYEALIHLCDALAPVRTAVVHPCDEGSLQGALMATDAGIIDPIFVGPKCKVERQAAALGRDISHIPLFDVPHSHAAAEKAVELARAGKVDALMKGSLHTDELMAEVVRKDGGLRTGRRVSHVFILDVPSYRKPLFITDAAVNIFPSLDDKADIVQNAIDLALVLGVALPKVAILSAAETVNSKIPSTIDAAALCKMADRGQITGGLLDGPLAFDNAISAEAAKTKHIVSDVAGDADILVVPDLEAGNMLAKVITFLAHADGAGIVLGAQVPIVLTSRADTPQARLASCAVAALYAQARRVRLPAVDGALDQAHA
jgi:phosphate acetyltransferase